MKKTLIKSGASMPNQHSWTPAGNIRAPSRETAVQWVFKAWEKFPQEMILHGLKSCGVTNSLDGDEDDHCFKKGQPNESGLQLLKEEETIEETE